MDISIESVLKWLGFGKKEDSSPVITEEITKKTEEIKMPENTEKQLATSTVCLDSLSLQRIEKLHPKLRQDAKDTLIDVAKALTGRASCRVTFTLRTFEEQQALYNLGRTVINPDGKSTKKPKGNIVTNAKAGQSLHNYGVALDFALIIDGKVASWDEKKDWDGDSQADWMEVVSIFKKHGWEWGGDWRTFKDMPHFQKTFGHDWPDLLAAKKAGKVDSEGYVII